MKKMLLFLALILIVCVAVGANTMRPKSMVNVEAGDPYTIRETFYYKCVIFDDYERIRIESKRGNFKINKKTQLCKAYVELKDNNGNLIKKYNTAFYACYDKQNVVISDELTLKLLRENGDKKLFIKIKLDNGQYLFINL